jgi:hypothetical protein
LNVKTQRSLFEKSSDTLKARAPSGDAGGSNRAEGTRLEEPLEFESKNSALSALSAVELPFFQQNHLREKVKNESPRTFVAESFLCLTAHGER